MLEYERTDISDGINVDMTNKSKECMLCRYFFYIKTLVMDRIFVMVAIT